MSLVYFYILYVKKSKQRYEKFLQFSLQIKKYVLLLHRQKQILGYGVMVTLQILVLSFLVRIQVAQLKRSSWEGRFFVRLPLFSGERVAYDYWISP